MRRSSIVFAITATLLAASVLPAEALTRVNTRIDPPRYSFVGGVVTQVSGSIDARRSACLVKRKVKVFTAPGVLFGEDVTNALGRYVVGGAGPRSNVYKITVNRKIAGRLACQAQSKFFFLP